MHKQGIELDEFPVLTPMRPWQGQMGAVLDGSVRATMVLEDVWKSTPQNEVMTKVIGQFDDCKPSIAVASEALDESVRRELLDTLISWIADWVGIDSAFKTC